MSATVTALARASLLNLAPTAAVSADGSATGQDITAYEGVGAVILDAMAGGTGALDTFLEESDVVGSGYTDVPATELYKEDGSAGAYSQITSAALSEVRFVKIHERKKFLRVRNDVTGSTSITRSVNLLAFKKYQT